MNKKIRLFIWLVVSVFVFFIATAIGVFVFTDSDAYKRYKMFTSVDNFADIIETYGFDELSPERDKFIKDINFIKKAEHKIKVDKITYVIFAYEFEDTDNARKYYKNVTGKTIEGNSSFSSSGNIYFKSSIILFQNNKVYRIEGQNLWDFQKFVEILSNELPEPFELGI